MKRIVITESQFDRLITNQVKKYNNKEVIEEGPKDWLLAGLLTLASMAGLSQTSKTISYDESKIEAAKEVQEKLNSGDEELSSLFDKANIELNRENLNKLLSVDIDGSEMDVLKTGSRSIAKSKLKQGYVLSDVKITSDTILRSGDAVYMGDTLTLDFDSDAAFVTATYTLTDEYKQQLIDKINEIYNAKGEIVKVTVESSTDTEPIKMGNKKLAQLRSNSVVDVLKYMGIDAVGVVNLPDQGPSVYSRTMTTKEREIARQQTAQYRYVKVTIEFEIEVQVPKPQSVQEIVNSYKFELVKVTPKQDVGTYKFRGRSVESKPLKNPKCKRVKYDGKMTACPADLMD